VKRADAPPTLVRLIVFCKKGVKDTPQKQLEAIFIKYDADPKKTKNKTYHPYIAFYVSVSNLPSIALFSFNTSSFSTR
jgi:hypothetical protein